MTELDSELQKICGKYGLSINETKKCCDDFLDAFQAVWDQIPDEEPIAFYGFNDAFAHMYNRVKNTPKNIVCIIENNSYIPMAHGVEIDKVPIIKINQIHEYKFNKIILTGFVSRYQMRQDIIAYDSNIKIIDVYEILEERGRRYDKFFYDLDWSTLYLALESVRKKYENSSDPESARKNLKLLIQTYLGYRDFVSADFYIQKYIDCRYNDSDFFIELKNELIEFIAKIKENIQSRSNKNVFVFVLDAFSFSMSQQAPFIKEFSQSSLSFGKAYSPGFYTRLSTFCLLTGKSYMENGFYKTTYLKKEDSDFLLDMKVSGYKVKHISHTSGFKFLSPVNDYNSLKLYGETQALLYWSLLTEMAGESESCIYFIHTLESHIPFYSGFPTKNLLFYDDVYRTCTSTPNEIPHKFKEHAKILRADAIKYVDRQLEFYLGLLNLDKDAVIITADHREWPPFLKAIGLPVTPDAEKISLIIHSKSVSPGIYENIYSTIDMPNLLRQLIRGDKKLKITPMEYARQEIEPAYGKNLKRETVFINLYGHIDFITSTEKYIFYFDGAEQYFLLSDLETNLIENEQYRERIDFFRSQISIDTRDVWKFMFEKYPHLLEAHKGRAEELLNEDKNPNKLRSQPH